MFQREKKCSVDRMLCTPELRTEFLAAVHPFSDGKTEAEILWLLVGFRKSKALPRTER